MTIKRLKKSVIYIYLCDLCIRLWCHSAYDVMAIHIVYIVLPLNTTVQSKQVVSGGSSSALLSDPSSQKINPSGGKASADVEGSIPQSTVAMTEAKYNGNTAAVIPSNMPPITMYGNSDGPAPGKPCLQSARLVTQNGNINLSKSLLIKSSLLLSEYGMPEHPLPTRAVCDIVDQVHTLHHIFHFFMS